LTDTPKKLFPLHWLTWLTAVTSVVLLLLSRGHYTIDVILAYFVTTRTWTTYHTVAGHTALRLATPINHFARLWWFEPVRWMEANVKPGALPHEYNWPLPRRLIKWLRARLRLSRRSKGATSTGRSKRGKANKAQS